MNPNAVIVYAHENGMYFRSINHQGEYIKGFFFFISDEENSESSSVIKAETYRKNGKLYTTITFENGIFVDSPHFNDVAWTTYLNYGILIEFEDASIKMSFFRDEEKPQYTQYPYLPDQKMWLRY